MTLRLFLNVVSLEARKAISYRLAFWIQAIVAVIAGFAIPYYLWTAIFSANPEQATIGGKSRDGMILYYVIVILISNFVRGVDMGLGLSREIYDGSLTRYLVYPTRYVVFKYAQNIGGLLPGFVQALFMAALFVTFLQVPAGVEITLMSTLQAIVTIAFANLLYYTMSLPIMGVAFWADNVWSLAVLMRFVAGFLGGLMLPLSAFPEGWIQDTLRWLPFRCFYDLPVSTFLGKIEFSEWLQALGLGAAWGILFALIGRFVWSRGDLRYTGVGI
ncbi:MAG: ABC-2 family transporter protein [Planctomycetota bacterium]